MVALFGTLGFECECLFFPAYGELYDLATTSIMALLILKNGFPRMSDI
jgi:hypothetical protein